MEIKHIEITEEMVRRYMKNGTLTAEDFCEYADGLDKGIAEGKILDDTEGEILRVIREIQAAGESIPYGLLSYQWWLCV
ncbi:hypothetical protein [[Clostridium] fimetarium]|uniref:Uncharacterized protein n=1 Tax=[Clostridium] fimetarium TaxID=99656 RepID=A0A1I0RD83_9FIRM|nr:hypothetical protein [[Clostridium] fimetarium]SEW38760.1 hypothetical protein SAMN05421659_11435 [[Clostridium] fimetarium]